MKKYILPLFVIALAFACSDPGVSSSDGDIGKNIFKKNCKLCHGADGKQMLNGAKDLNLSTMTIAERINIITNGKKVMVPFKDVLTAEEIKAVAEYTKKTFNSGK